LSFENVTFKYNNLDEPTLQDINLSIEEEKKYYNGKSGGSGKSTLAHCINGLIPFTYKGEIQGRVTVNGKEPKSLSLLPWERRWAASSRIRTAVCRLSSGEDVAFALENDCVPPEDMDLSSTAH
jgi:energy-coupling factor transport system ATP-binding protein